MDQRHSVFMPGLTRRGPVINALGQYLGDMSTLSPFVMYGGMAVLAYLAYKKKIPLIAAGAGAAGIYYFMSGSTAAAAAQGSGVPSAQDISNTTAGAAIIQPPDLSNVPMPTVSIPNMQLNLSGAFIGNSPLAVPKAFIS
jgi:hypothetical protein